MRSICTRKVLVQCGQEMVAAVGDLETLLFLSSLRASAGWCITSVFLLQASENLSTLCCMSTSEAALRAQSSANRRLLIMMVSVETLVFARSLLRLKSDPSYLYLMVMPASESLKASDSIVENMKVNRVGASTQPCFTPLETGNGAEVSPLSCTLASMP